MGDLPGECGHPDILMEGTPKWKGHPGRKKLLDKWVSASIGRSPGICSVRFGYPVVVVVWISSGVLWGACFLGIGRIPSEIETCVPAHSPQIAT
jgi:hypothetical protein